METRTSSWRILDRLCKCPFTLFFSLSLTFSLIFSHCTFICSKFYIIKNVKRSHKKWLLCRNFIVVELWQFRYVFWLLVHSFVHPVKCKWWKVSPYSVLLPPLPLSLSHTHTHTDNNITDNNALKGSGWMQSFAFIEMTNTYWLIGIVISHKVFKTGTRTSPKLIRQIYSVWL